MASRDLQCARFGALFAAALAAWASAACRSGTSGAASARPSPGGSFRPDGAPNGSTALPLPGGANGIGFDDLVFGGGLRRVLAPAAETGNLDLIDPDTLGIVPMSGFSATKGSYAGGHGFGTTSADEGEGLLFAVDRTAGRLDVVDPRVKAIVASTKLGASPDYVRWVDATREVWVTEPDRDGIEVFAVPSGPGRAPAYLMNIRVDGGPESLVIDGVRKRAFSHLWSGSTVAIDLASHAVVATWSNGCGGSRGIALDSGRGWLFAGCSEGKVTVLDIGRDGRLLGAATSGAGVDVIAYNPRLSHVYLPGASSATMAVVGIGATGVPTVLGTLPTANGAHCVAADDRNHAWVCDPEHGQLLVFDDTYPASTR